MNTDTNGLALLHIVDRRLRLDLNPHTGIGLGGMSVGLGGLDRGISREFPADSNG